MGNGLLDENVEHAMDLLANRDPGGLDVRVVAAALGAARSYERERATKSIKAELDKWTKAYDKSPGVVAKSHITVLSRLVEQIGRDDGG